MKTNVKLQSTDRNLFGINVEQESKTGFLSITDLMKAYEILKSTDSSLPNKDINHILSTYDSRLRIYNIICEVDKLLKINNIEEPQYGGSSNKLKINNLSINYFNNFDEFSKYIDDNGIIKTLKRLKYYKEGGNNHTGKRIYANPYIWTLLAMELNPLIYAKTVIWLTDGLILFRNGAGDSFKNMNRRVTLLEGVQLPDIYWQVARMINYVVFNKHENDIRDVATIKQLELIKTIEDEITMLIDFGYIKTKDDLVLMLKKYYVKQNPNNINIIK